MNPSVIGTNCKVITGPYAADELAGGTLGNKCLGCNSLLDWVAFGRVADKHAAKATLGANVSATNLRDLLEYYETGHRRR